MPHRGAALQPAYRQLVAAWVALWLRLTLGSVPLAPLQRSLPVPTENGRSAQPPAFRPGLVSSDHHRRPSPLPTPTGLFSLHNRRLRLRLSSSTTASILSLPLLSSPNPTHKNPQALLHTRAAPLSPLLSPLIAIPTSTAPTLSSDLSSVIPCLVTVPPQR